MTFKKILEPVVLGVLCLAFFFLYLTCSPSAFKNNDSPETIAAAYTLGIGHQPGYPLYTLLGKIASLPLIGSPAFRVNLLASMLAIICLLLTFFMLKRILFSLTSIPVFWPAVAGTAILGISNLFWSLSVEAKGGIYILNLLFILAVFYLLFSFLYKPAAKTIYLAFFLFGLSLSNHWPSAVLAGPFIAYAFIRHAKTFTLKKIILLAAFFTLGLTPYLYILIRSAVPALEVKWAHAQSFNGLWDIISRKGYVDSAPAPGKNLFQPQLAEFFLLLKANYGFLLLAAFPGMVILFKKSREIFFILLSFFITACAAILFVNKTAPEYITVIHPFFLMPLSTLAVFIAAGFAYLIDMLKNHIYRAFLVAAVLALSLFHCASNFSAHNYSRDFLAFDAGKNISKSIAPGSLYLAEGDYAVMPLTYLYSAAKQRRDIKFARVSLLPFGWYLDNFKERYGFRPTHEFMPDNAKALVEHFIAFAPVFRNDGSFLFEKALKLPYYSRKAGLLSELDPYKTPSNTYIFSLYSYRWLPVSTTGFSSENALMYSAYFVSMVNAAGFCALSKDYSNSLRLYSMALPIPASAKESVYYNMAMIYRNMNMPEESLACLENAVKINPAFIQAYGEAGLILYEIKDYGKAAIMLRLAKLKGSQDPRILNLLRGLETK